MRGAGEKASGPIPGPQAQGQGPGGTYHVRHPAGNMGLNRSLFFQLDNMLQAPLSSSVPAHSSAASAIKTKPQLYSLGSEHTCHLLLSRTYAPLNVALASGWPVA